ncbi:MAG: hypothetical protein PHF74_04110 [Dehalococcoidales bacterium]|nr:hypothetical protein [Dehalococcoidales bacterium]
MIINRFLSPKGWRVVSHSLLAANALAIIYLLSQMAFNNIQQGNSVNWWVWGSVYAILLFITTIGSMLAKAELTEWR